MKGVGALSFTTVGADVGPAGDARARTRARGGGRRALRVPPERDRGLVGGGGELVDGREPSERGAGTIPDDRHIELARLSAEAGSLPRDRPVVVYCRVGSRSYFAAQALRGA